MWHSLRKQIYLQSPENEKNRFHSLKSFFTSNPPIKFWKTGRFSKVVLIRLFINIESSKFLDWGLSNPAYSLTPFSLNKLVLWCYLIEDYHYWFPYRDKGLNGSANFSVLVCLYDFCLYSSGHSLFFLIKDWT